MFSQYENGPENPLRVPQIFSIINNYRVPIILGIVGIGLMLGSIVLILKRQADNEVQFVQRFDNSSTPSGSSKIMVDIEGAVMEPGLYPMTMGSRVDDLIVRAGGLSSSADREWSAKSLNRAAKLIDGGKVYIPSINDNIANTTGDNNLLGSTDSIMSDSKININSASLAQLDKLPGVGQVTAQKIISGRPYQTVDELKSKKVVGNALFEKIKEIVVVY